MRRPYAAPAALLGLAACAACAATPSLIADAPADSTAPPRIALSGLAPGTDIRLTVERPGDWNPETLQRSVTVYRADGRGRIDTAENAPLEGGFDAPDPYGVFWSVAPTEDASPDGATPSDAVIRADIDGDGTDDLTAALTLPLGHDSTTETPLGADFPGAFVTRPEGTQGERLPVIVALGGSGGGDGAVRFAAPRLAALGYAVLGLPYYSPAYWGQEPQFPSLPRAFAELPVDYVEDAVAALRERGDVDPDRVALYGVSKGGELVLLAASLIPDDSPGGGYCAVAAIVPSDVVWEGWGAGREDRYPSFSWRGAPLPFVPYLGMDEAIASMSTQNRIDLRVPHDEGRAAHPDRVGPAMIDVAAIGEPVYALGGDADRTWDSGSMVREVEKRRGSMKTLALAYPNGDHGLSGTAYRRARPGTAAARAEAWPKLAAFLDEHMSEENCADARRR